MSRSWRRSHHARSCSRTAPRNRRRRARRSSAGIDERTLEHVGGAGHVGRGDRQRIRRELLRGPGRLRQHEDRQALPDEHRLLGHEVHAVDDRVHEDDVGAAHRRDRHRVVRAVVDPDRLVVGLGQAVDAGDHLADRGGVLGVLADGGPRRRVDGHEADRRTELRVAVQQLLEGEEAAERVLRRFDAVGAHDHPRVAGPLETSLETRLPVGHALGPGEPGKAVGIDRDRIRRDADPPVAPADRAPVTVDPGVAHEARDGVQELVGVAVGLEADDVAAQQPLADRAADALGQHLPDARRRPRDVVEVEDRGVGPQLTNERGGQVQVVVLEEHDRALHALRRLDDGLRQRPVGGPVAIAPRVDQRTVDVRAVRQRVHLVLQEPQERVRHGLVEGAVHVARQVDVVEPQVLAGQQLVEQLAHAPGNRPLARRDRPEREMAPPQFGRGDPVAVRGGGRDPGDRRVAPHLGEGRDQAARAA